MAGRRDGLFKKAIPEAVRGGVIKKLIMGLYSKLLNIQKGIAGLAKDGKAYGYEYVTGGKLLKELRPLMDKEGLILKQEVLSVTNTRQDYRTKSGEKSEILSLVNMRFTWIDTETGEKDENLFSATGQNDWDKGIGSALTYAERYFLLKFFHIATDEDDIDNPARKERDQQKQEREQEEYIRQVNDFLILNDKARDYYLSKYSKGQLADLSKQEYTEIYNELKKGKRI